jgi:hypothetical protein
MPQYVVCLSSWAGISYVPVEVLQRQLRRVKVRFLQATVGKAQGAIGYPPYKAVGHWEGQTWVPLARAEAPDRVCGTGPRPPHPRGEGATAP